MNKDNYNEWKKELDQAPELQKQNGELPFTVPDGYFDNFAAGVQDKIAQQSQQPKSIFSFIFSKKVLIPAFTVAAIVIAFLTVKPKKEEEENYISMNYDEIYNAALVNDLDETLLGEYAIEITPVTSEEENYLIESANEEVLINEL